MRKHDFFRAFFYGVVFVAAILSGGVASAVTTGQLTWGINFGAITHILGPTDQPLALASQNNKNITISPNGTGEVLVSSSAATGTTLFAVTDGGVGLTVNNGSSSVTPVLISGIPDQATGNRRTLDLYDTTALAADVGPEIAFISQFNTSGPQYTTFAGNGGHKENGNNNDTAGYWFAGSNPGGTGAYSEGIRLTSQRQVNLAGITTVGTIGYVLTRSDAVYQWANGTSGAVSADTGWSRGTAGVICAGTGAQGSTAGSIKCQSLVSTKTAASYNVLATDTNTCFNNNGAGAQVQFNLPASAVGLRYSFYVATAQNVRLAGNGAETIRIGSDVSTATTGHVDSATVGSYIILECQVAGQWVAISTSPTSTTVGTPTWTKT